MDFYWFGFVEYRISMIFLLLFIYFCLPQRFEKRITIALLGITFIVTGVVDYVYFHIVSQQYALPITFIQACIVQVTALIICQYRDLRAVFVAITGSVYVLAGNIFCITVDIYSYSHMLALVVQTLIHSAILYIIVSYIRDSLVSELHVRNVRWGALCMIPISFYLVEFTLIAYPNDVRENPELIAPALLVLVLMAIVYGLMIKVSVQERMQRTLEHDKEVVDIYSDSLSRESIRLYEIEERTAILRHDVRHIYALLLSYMKANELDKMKSLLEERLGNLEESAGERICENLAINGILNHIIFKAESKNIKFIYQVDVPKMIKTNHNEETYKDEFSLATIVMNLLENALDAVDDIKNKEQRYVELRMYPVKKQLLLEVENPYNRKPQIDELTGLLKSVKGEGHGYGLRSVQAYAKQNDSLFQYEIKDGKVTFQMLINIQ